MGGSLAKAEGIVDAELTAAISVTMDVVTSIRTTVTNINQITISGNCELNIDTLNQGNIATLDMTSMTTAVMDNKFEQDVKQAVTQAADAAAKAALGIAASDSEAIMQSIILISTAVKSSVQNLVQTDVTNENIWGCADQGHANIRIFNQTNAVSSITKAVTNTEQVTTATQTAVQDITQYIKSLATGLDPTILAVMAVAVVLAIIGVSLFGVNKVANLLVTPQFWFVVSLTATLGASILDLIKLTGLTVWPYSKDDADRNRAIFLISSIVGGAALLSTGITGYMVVKSKSQQATTGQLQGF
jgi:hypothetical protein